MTAEGVTRHLLVQTGDSGHRLEECRLHGAGFAPIGTPAPENTFLIAIALDGRTRWQLGDESLVLPPDALAAFPAVPALRALREGDGEARFLLWRYQMDTVRAVRLSLGQIQPAPPPAPANPVRDPASDFSGPLPLSPALRMLILALRTPPVTPLRTLWYGAKLLELFALLHQLAAPTTPDTGLHPGVQRALVFMHASFAESISLADIARSAGLSPTYLSQIFASEVGRPLNQHLRHLRLEHASRLLRCGECNVTEAALAVGYASVGQFSHAFRRAFGHPPGVHRPRYGGLGTGREG